MRGTGNHAVALAAALQRNRSLRTLNLAQSRLGTAEDLQLILEALGGSTEKDGATVPASCVLDSLDISHCVVGIDCAAALGRSLARGATLRVLKARDCRIWSAPLWRIADGVLAAGERCRLETLDLSDNICDSDGAH